MLLWKKGYYPLQKGSTGAFNNARLTFFFILSGSLVNDNRQFIKKLYN